MSSNPQMSESISIPTTNDAPSINLSNCKPFPETSSDSEDEESSTIAMDNQGVCEYIHCRKESSTGKLYNSTTITNLVICKTCEQHERKHGTLQQRVRQLKFPSNAVCEYCKEHSSKPNLSQSITTEFQLCDACRKYEKKNGKLVPRNQRGRHRSEKHPSNAVCEYCKEQSCKPYLSQSTTTEFQLCNACKKYETKYGKLVPRNQRRRHKSRAKKAKKKEMCEYIHCRKDSSTGKLYNSKTITNLVICKACEEYERKFGTLKRKFGQRKNRHVSNAVCEYCKQHSCKPNLSPSITTEFQVCDACRQYEAKYGELVPRNQRGKCRRREIKSNQKVCQYIHCQKESSNGKWYKSTTTPKIYIICKACDDYERNFGTLKRPVELQPPKRKY